MASKLLVFKNKKRHKKKRRKKQSFIPFRPSDLRRQRPPIGVHFAFLSGLKATGETKKETTPVLIFMSFICSLLGSSTSFLVEIFFPFTTQKFFSLGRLSNELAHFCPIIFSQCGARLILLSNTRAFVVSSYPPIPRPESRNLPVNLILSLLHHLSLSLVSSPLTG